ncbi:unnamed protein product [marine sediment metagenome]|uniref:Uncharacterized protein n=1 Tax=marine sediment metagenome TaxID=412755 RepID=X1BEI3_9ZZZZ
MAPVSSVYGVNSTLPDGNHILMWDFDDTYLDAVAINLSRVQSIYNLPNIYILETKKDKNFIAYCFKSCTWHKAIEIIAFTRNVDANFFKFGVYREKFTLRVTPKSGRTPKLVFTLKSNVKETANIKMLQSWTQYQTLTDAWKSIKRELII